MKKSTCIFCILAVLVFVTACAKNEEFQAKESVVQKEVEQYNGFRPEQTKLTTSDTFEENGVCATVTDISYEDVVTKLHFHVKNDTDAELRVMTANVSVNGLMLIDNLDCPVLAKSETDGVLEISNEWLDKMAIGKITDVEFIIKAYDANNDEIMQSEVIQVKTDAKNYEQNYDRSGFVLYQEKDIILAVRSLQKNALSGDTELVFYAENNSRSAISVMSMDVTVNGKEFQPEFVLTVGAGKKAVDTMVFPNGDLTENEIGEITELKAAFKAFDEELRTVFETECMTIPLA